MQISFILLTFVLKNCRLFIACKIGKQCKPVQVHPFSRFSLWVNLRKLLVGEASPIPFERYLRYRLLVHSERFCRYYFWTNWYAPNKADRKITLGVNTGWANEKKLLLRKKSHWWRNILRDGCGCERRRGELGWVTPPWRVGSAGIARREFRHWRRMGIAPNGSTARTSSAKWRRSTCPVRAVPWPSRKSIICAPGIWYWTG